MFSKSVLDLISDEKYLLVQDKYDGNLNLKYETLFTLANGYMSVRGSFEEGSVRERRGTYIAGVFDKSEAQVKELVNVQSWLGLRLYSDDLSLDPETCEILEFARVLDMKKGVLFKHVKYRDSRGGITLVEGYRFLSRNNVHRAAVKLFVTPLNYSKTLLLESVLDGSVINSKGMPAQQVSHTRMSGSSGFTGDRVYLETVTKDDRIHVSTGAATRIYDAGTGHNLAESRRTAVLGEQLSECSEFKVIQGHTVEIDKFVAVYTSRDVDKSALKKTVMGELDYFIADEIGKELDRHSSVYSRLWNNADIMIEGDDDADRALRFNIFHLLSCVNEKDPFVSIGAKALHGEGYKGHVFWDTEIFMLPFYIYAFPEAAKTLLLYRYNLLEAAKRNAGAGGYRGARFPWESADTGLEETPRWGRNYLGETVRIWTGDIEYHVNADIAYAIYNYYAATGDMDFMLGYGAEIFVETARFWVSRCEYDKAENRYEINCVIGPDEFHEHIDNNFYTNYLAKWNIRKAIELLREIREKHPGEYRAVSSKTLLTLNELSEWEKVMEGIYIAYDDKRKLVEQFEGYFEKKDYIIEKYDENDMPAWPEGVDIANLNETRLVKQADVLMLLLLLEEEFDEEIKKVNYEYYEKRTMHKSSLGPSMYAIMGIKTGDVSRAYKYFLRTANVDLVDNQGNTADGIHAASLGGTWQVAVFGFGGMHRDGEGVLNFRPWLPERWKSLKFRVFREGRQLEVNITRDGVKVDILPGGPGPLKIRINGETVELLSPGGNLSAT